MLERKYWLFLTTKENWKICERHGVYGDRVAGKFKEAKRGDLFVAYAVGKVGFCGHGIVMKDFFTSCDRVWKGGVYPNRVGVKLNLSLEKPVPVSELIGKLSFTRDTKYWAMRLRAGVIPLSKEDYSLIYHEIRAKGSESREGK